MKNNHVNKLYETIIKLNTVQECKDFFKDLCTYREIEQMAQRVYSAELLLKGETYENVIKETDISSATLSRVSKCVKQGNGYRKFLKED